MPLVSGAGYTLVAMDVLLFQYPFRVKKTLTMWDVFQTENPTKVVSQHQLHISPTDVLVGCKKNDRTPASARPTVAWESKKCPQP